MFGLYHAASWWHLFSDSDFAVGVHHGDRMCLSIASILVHMWEIVAVYFRDSICVGIQAVLVRRAFVSHSCIGCFVESDCIRVVARKVLVWSRIHAGCRPVSISIAAMGVVL